MGASGAEHLRGCVDLRQPVPKISVVPGDGNRGVRRAVLAPSELLAAGRSPGAQPGAEREDREHGQAARDRKSKRHSCSLGPRSARSHQAQLRWRQRARRLSRSL